MFAPSRQLFLLLLLLIIDDNCIVFASDDGHVTIDLIRHQACSWRKDWSKWQRKIQFEGGHRNMGARLVADAKQPGCYAIHGQVTVYEPINEQLTIFLAVSGSGDQNVPPEPCHDADAVSGCGGVGSCVYCSPCDQLRRGMNVAQAELQINGVPIDCKRGLAPGTYTDVTLRFCLPSWRTVLEWQGLNESTLQTLLNSTNNSPASISRLGIFTTVYIFDKDVLPLLQSQRKLETRLRKSAGIGKEDQLNQQIYWSLPFNQIIKEQKLYIGCHKLYGTVQFDDRPKHF